MKTRDAIKRFKELAAEYDKIMSNFPNGLNSFDNPVEYEQLGSIRKEMKSFVYDNRVRSVEYGSDGQPNHVLVVRPALRELTRGWEF